MRTCALLLVCCAAIAGPAAAQSFPVVVVQPRAADAQLGDAFNRLQAELHIHGFDTRIREGELDPDPSAALRQLGAREEAVAAFAFVRRNDAATLEVVLFERKTGDTSARRLALERGTDAASLIAVRAVDLLRAALQEFPEDEPPPEPAPAPEPPPPPAATRAAVPTGARAFSIAAEGTMLWTGPRFGVAFGPALGVFHHPMPWLRWGLWIAGPVLGPALETSSGSATVRQELGFLEARFSLLRTGRFELGPLAGAGVYLLQADGRARSPLRSESDSVWSGLFAIGVHAEQGLGAGFGLGLSVRALGLVPELGVAVARERATLSFPSLQAALGVGLGF